jgi:formate hydrogenlyase subunit 3/multisubunit Na+/H+ antiporter MnhD subunit
MRENVPRGDAIKAAGTASANLVGALPSTGASPVTPGAPSDAAEWGLAGLLSGIAICLAFPISLILIGLGAADYHKGRGWERSDLEVATTITFLAEWVLIGLPALGLLEGLFGLVTGRFRKSHLAKAGIVAALAALFFSILLMIATRHISNGMWKEQERREQARPQPRGR